MSDRDSWPFDDDRDDREAALELANRLDRDRKRKAKPTTRLRFRRVKQPKTKGE